MSKLSLIILLGVMSCLLEEAYSNNFYYYPNSQPALNYQYQPFPYVYSAYAVPVDCDKSTTEGAGEGGTSESSSSESTSSESTEGGSTEVSSESSGEEKKEGGEPSSSEEGGKKEGPAEEKKEDSKKKVPQYVFPPVTYPYAPLTAQQVVYSAPGYMPYKTYSVVSQPATYSSKSSGYNTYPYYSLSSVPVSGSYSSPVSTRIVPSPNVGGIVAPATYAANSYPAMSKTISYAPASGVAGPAGYWNGNVGYYRV